MNLDELTSKIQSVGLHAVRVESIPDRAGDLRFVGTLAEYLQAVKAVSSPVLFVSTIELSEDHFFYQEADGDSDPEIEVDLCAALSSLSSFKKMIGHAGHFELSIPHASTNLKFSIIEGWWRDFVEQHAAANTIIESERDEKLEKLGEAEAQEAHLATEKLRSLINDKQFVALPTQRAMREYALEKLPELALLEPQDIKREIQDLSARIHAKGLGRR